MLSKKKTQQTYTYSGPVPLIQARNAACSYSYFCSCSSVCGEHNIIVDPMLMTVVMWQPTEVYVYTIVKCQGGLGWSWVLTCRGHVGGGGGTRVAYF